MRVTYQNDGNQKYQSCEVRAETTHIDKMHNGCTCLAAYGATQDEAYNNLADIAKKMIAELQNFVDNHRTT